MKVLMLSLVSILGFFVCRPAFSAPEMLLLQQWSADKFDIQSEWLVSEKLDGVRAYWNGERLLSRQGNVINAPDWFIEGLPPFELDGELWMGRQRFADTYSIVSQFTPDKRWRKIGYYIFEVPNQTGGLLERLQVLQNYLNSSQHEINHLFIIEQKPVANQQQLEKMLRQLSKQKAEGLVVRKADEPYRTGRLHSALKLKLKQGAECEVVGYTSGKGKYKGKVGALKCELITEQVARLFPDLNSNTMIRIGSGLTDKLRASPPAIGAIIKFEYTGLTKNGLPRFPVYKGLDKRL